jgi:NTE family protein
MASTCLPTLFQAVEIDGQSYWDGGFSSNPSLLAPDQRVQQPGHDRGADQSAAAPDTPHTPPTSWTGSTS